MKGDNLKRRLTVRMKIPIRAYPDTCGLDCPQLGNGLVYSTAFYHCIPTDTALKVTELGAPIRSKVCRAAGG